MFGVCSFDDKHERVLSEYFEASDNMTIEKCVGICRSKNYPFSGLEYQKECHCGYEPADGFEYAWSDKCNLHCSGDSSQICGGSDAMNIWSSPPIGSNGFCAQDFPNNRRVLPDRSITGDRNMTAINCKNFCKG